MTGNPTPSRPVVTYVHRLAVSLALVLTAAPAGVRAQPAQRPVELVKAKPGQTATSRVVIDRVVAVVNDAVVLESELNQRVAPLAADLDDATDPKDRERRRKKLAGQVLDEMVNEELIVQAAAEAKLEVNEEEIDNALEEIKRQNKLGDEQLAAALATQGYTVAGYRKDVRRQIVRMRAVNVLVRPRVTVSDDDVRAHYDALNRRSGAVNEVRLQHILIALPEEASERDLAAAKAKAAEVIGKAKAGEDFRTLAKQYSDDGATRNSGGDLGWIKRGSIATEWEVIVFAMEKGEVRGPINGPRGLHVFYVSELRKSEVKPFDEVKEAMRNELYRIEMDKQTRLWLEELRKKAHVVLKL